MPFVWLFGRMPFVLSSWPNTVCMVIRANAIRIIIMTEYRLYGYLGEYNSYYYHVRIPFAWSLGRMPFVLLSWPNTVCMGIRANAIRIIIMAECRLYGYSGECNSYYYHVRMPFAWLLGRMPFVLLSWPNTVCMVIWANTIRPYDSQFPIKRLLQNALFQFFQFFQFLMIHCFQFLCFGS